MEASFLVKMGVVLGHEEYKAHVRLDSINVGLPPRGGNCQNVQASLRDLIVVQ